MFNERLTGVDDNRGKKTHGRDGDGEVELAARYKDGEPSKYGIVHPAGLNDRNGGPGVSVFERTSNGPDSLPRVMELYLTPI